MKTVKSWLCNQISDQLIHDWLVTYIEKDAFDSVDNEAIVQQSKIWKLVENNCNFFLWLYMYLCLNEIDFTNLSFWLCHCPKALEKIGT